VDVWIIFHVSSGLELKHMEKGKIQLPWSDFFHLRDGLVAVVNDPDGKFVVVISWPLQQRHPLIRHTQGVCWGLDYKLQLGLKQ
jgi:hypothetical protein